MSLEKLTVEIAELKIHENKLEGLNTVPPDDDEPEVMVCWVARAVYGAENPRWMLFREWLLSDAPSWFRALYLQRGASFALWLAPHRTLKSLIRLWMDSMIRRKRA